MGGTRDLGGMEMLFFVAMARTFYWNVECGIGFLCHLVYRWI